MSASIFDDWLRTSRKSNGGVYRNYNEMERKIDNNTYGRSYTYTTDANAIWLHQSKEFSPLYPISTTCWLCRSLEIFFSLSKGFWFLCLPRFIAQLGGECHTQFCLAGIRIPLRQPLRPLLTYQLTSPIILAMLLRHADDASSLLMSHLPMFLRTSTRLLESPLVTITNVSVIATK